MKVEIITRNQGKVGATFQIKLGEKVIPYRLSLHGMRQLEYAVGQAIEDHKRAQLVKIGE